MTGLPRRRRAQLGAGVAALAVLAAACGTSGSGDGATTGDANGAAADDQDVTILPSSVVGEPVDQVNETPGAREEGVESALQAVLERPIDPDSFPEDMPAEVDVDEILPGGPPPDGIAPVENPFFAPAGEIDFLRDTEPVQVVEIDGDVRAYPMQIMTRHEIVNDTVGGVPVSVVFCPLCNSALVYEREVGDRVLDFGTSGMLRNSALVMYDRQTETLWDHFTSSGIVGELAGAKLELVPMQLLGWETFLDEHPDGLVMTRETGHDVSPPYGVNPYSGYDDIGESPFLFQGEEDDRLPLMQRLVTLSDDDLPADLRSGAQPIAVLQDGLVERGVIEVEMGETTFTVWAEPGAATGLEGGIVAAGRDVGQTGVFVPEVDGRELTFERDGEDFVDNETGSRWNIVGRATSGELEGSELQPIPHLNTFWFAWAAFQPDTEIIEP